MNSKNVLIIGSGVSGLTTALELLQGGHTVTVWSKEAAGMFPCTSANAYAMWVPVKIDSDPRVERWTDEGFIEFEKLARSTQSGVAMRQIVVLKQEHEEPWYAKKMKNFRHGRADEMSSQYKDAHILEGAPVIDPTVYLPWLRQRVLIAGGVFVQREVRTLDECPASFSVIINCSGLGARKLAGDADLYPERVQVVKIRANGFNKVVIDDDGPNKRACIVPHANYIRIGAVFDGNQESLEVENRATQEILERCSRMVPGFKADLGEVLSVDRALRPERSLTRVEAEKLADGRSVVHNYGHDGMGYILSYGIAAEICRLLKDA